MRLPDDPLDDEVVRQWLTEESSRGIHETATILFPEVYGVELLDFLSIRMTEAPDGNESRDAWNRHRRARRLYEVLVETLPYRASEAITQRTIDLLNEAQRWPSHRKLGAQVGAAATVRCDGTESTDGTEQFSVLLNYPLNCFVRN